VFDGDYDRAIAISEVCAMEPCYQPSSPPKVQTKGKKPNPINLKRVTRIGYVDPEINGKTIAEAVSEAEQVFELLGPVLLDNTPDSRLE